MECEKCKANMSWFSKDSVRGWSCSSCGWNLVTTNISEIYEDMTEYSIYIKNVIEVNKEIIKLIARIAEVNFIIARQMLIGNNVCILKAKAPKVKKVIEELEELKIQFEVSPKFKY